MKLETLPGIDERVHVAGDGLIGFVLVSVDDDQGDLNPCSGNYGESRVVSLCTRHASFDKEAFDANHKNPDCVLLGYFEHGSCIWYVSPVAGGHIPVGCDCPFDNVRVAGLWMPGDWQREELAKIRDRNKRRSRALAMASSDAEAYTAWNNGEVYYVAVDIYKACYDDEDGSLVTDWREYESEDPLYTESCGGILAYGSAGNDHMLDMVNSMLCTDGLVPAETK